MIASSSDSLVDITQTKNTDNILKHPPVRHGLEFQECRVFDSLHTSATASQTCSVSIMRVNHHVKIRLANTHRQIFFFFFTK